MSSTRHLFLVALLVLSSVGCVDREQTSVLKQPTQQQLIEYWEPFGRLMKVPHNIRVVVDTSDVSVDPWTVTSNQSYIDMLVRLSYSIRINRIPELPVHTRQDGRGTWHFAVDSLLLNSGGRYRIGWLYLQDDSVVHYPACIVVNLNTLNSHINLDYVGRIYRSVACAPDSSLKQLHCTCTCSNNQEINRMDSISVAELHRYFASRRLDLDDLY